MGIVRKRNDVLGWGDEGIGWHRIYPVSLKGGLSYRPTSWRMQSGILHPHFMSYIAQVQKWPSLIYYGWYSAASLRLSTHINSLFANTLFIYKLTNYTEVLLVCSTQTLHINAFWSIQVYLFVLQLTNYCRWELCKKRVCDYTININITSL